MITLEHCWKLGAVVFLTFACLETPKAKYTTPSVMLKTQSLIVQEERARLIEGACGNGTLEGTERCDDGNTIGGDGCSAHCSLEVKKVLSSNVFLMSDGTLAVLDAPLSYLNGRKIKASAEGVIQLSYPRGDVLVNLADPMRRLPVSHGEIKLLGNAPSGLRRNGACYLDREDHLHCSVIDWEIREDSKEFVVWNTHQAKRIHEASPFGAGPVEANYLVGNLEVGCFLYHGGKAARCWSYDYDEDDRIFDFGGEPFESKAKLFVRNINFPSGVVFTELHMAYENICGLSTAGDVYCWETKDWFEHNRDWPSGRRHHLLKPKELKISERHRVSLSSPASNLRVSFGLMCSKLENGELWCWRTLHHSPLISRSAELDISKVNDRKLRHIQPSEDCEVVEFEFEATYSRFCSSCTDGCTRCWNSAQEPSSMSECLEF